MRDIRLYHNYTAAFVKEGTEMLEATSATIRLLTHRALVLAYPKQFAVFTVVEMLEEHDTYRLARVERLCTFDACTDDPNYVAPEKVDVSSILGLDGKV